MLLPSIRRLALADVNPEVLRQLVDHGESLYVERKRRPPEPPRLGALAASFANMLGGFILLGVEDDGRVEGWRPPGRSDLQSHVGELLRAEVDPLPPYIAGTRQLDGKDVGVVRIFESSDSPHIVTGTGAIVVRTSKGKEPISPADHATVLSMARRGQEAEERARARLRETPVVNHVLRTPDSGLPSTAFHGVEVIARAAPLTVTPALSDWPLTRRAADFCLELAAKLRPPAGIQGFDFARQGPDLRPHGRAVAAEVTQQMSGSSADEAVVVADSAGVVAAALRRGAHSDDPPSLLINALLDEEVVPLAQALADLLREAEAYGRAVVDLWVLLGPEGRLSGQYHEPLDPDLHVSRDLTIPADENEVRELALEWHRELQRNVGIPKFEGESETNG